MCRRCSTPLHIASAWGTHDHILCMEDTIHTACTMTPHIYLGIYTMHQVRPLHVSWARGEHISHQSRTGSTCQQPTLNQLQPTTTQLDYTESNGYHFICRRYKDDKGKRHSRPPTLPQHTQPSKLSRHRRIPHHPPSFIFNTRFAPSTVSVCSQKHHLSRFRHYAHHARGRSQTPRFGNRTGLRLAQSSSNCEIRRSQEYARD